MRRALAAVAALAMLLVVPSTAVASSSEVWSLVGTYTIPFTCVTGCPSPPDYPYSVTIITSSTSTGMVSGTGYYITGGGYPAVTVSGQVTGSDVSLTLLYTDPGLSGYNPFVLTGTIDALGGMSGTAIDGQGRTFTWLTTSGAAKFITADSHAKSDVVPYPTGAAVGAVVFNTSAGDPNGLELTLQVKKVEPNTAFDVYLFIDTYASGYGVVLGTFTTNGMGNGTFHANTDVVSPGIHTVAVDVTLSGSPADHYVTPGLYGQNLYLYFK